MSESMALLTKQPVTIEQIAIHAMKAEFKTYLSPNVENSLVVEFVIENGGRYFTGTTRFLDMNTLELYKTQPELLGDYEIVAIETFAPASVIYIDFQVNTVPIIMPLLKALLQDFDGLLLSHNGNPYTASTIEELMKEV